MLTINNCSSSIGSADRLVYYKQDSCQIRLRYHINMELSTVESTEVVMAQLASDQRKSSKFN